MLNGLPQITGAGLFESYKRFKNIKTTPERQLISYEFELFTADGGVSHLNGDCLNIKKGYVLIAKPGDVRHSELHFSCKYLHFETDEPETKKILSSIPSFIKLDLTSELTSYFDRIYNYMIEGKEFSDVYIASALYTLICKIKTLSDKNLIENKDSKYYGVLAARRYMDDNFANQITGEDVAKAAGFSVSHLHKMFLSATGETPNSYLTSIRISAAKEMLLSGNTPIDIIAQNCGFSSTSYFNHRFKIVVGIPPAQFRKNAGYLV